MSYEEEDTCNTCNTYKQAIGQALQVVCPVRRRIHEIICPMRRRIHAIHMCVEFEDSYLMMEAF